MSFINTIQFFFKVRTYQNTYCFLVIRINVFCLYFRNKFFLKDLRLNYTKSLNGIVAAMVATFSANSLMFMTADIYFRGRTHEVE